MYKLRPNTWHQRFIYLFFLNEKFHNDLEGRKPRFPSFYAYKWRFTVSVMKIIDTAHCWRTSVVFVLASRWHSRSEPADVAEKFLSERRFGSGASHPVSHTELLLRSGAWKCAWPEALAVCESVKHPNHNLTCCNYFFFFFFNYRLTSL